MQSKSWIRQYYGTSSSVQWTFLSQSSSLYFYPVSLCILLFIARIHLFLTWNTFSLSTAISFLYSYFTVIPTETAYPPFLLLHLGSWWLSIHSIGQNQLDVPHELHHFIFSSVKDMDYLVWIKNHTQPIQIIGPTCQKILPYMICINGLQLLADWKKNLSLELNLLFMDGF